MRGSFDAWFVVGALAFVPPILHLFEPIPVVYSLAPTFLYAIHVLMVRAKHGTIRHKALGGVILVFFEAWLFVGVTAAAISIFFLIYAATHLFVEG